MVDDYFSLENVPYKVDEVFTFLGIVKLIFVGGICEEDVRDIEFVGWCYVGR